ncbi:MAG: divalent-cation tolerance protein CutA [Actinomycetota bacterium]|nr:divalent-cation tolerance protein CutA [Actinomycetota bacterium]MDA3007900.1 divalent-cation tolerance protein CutA [Actinomycetota bacterium]MDA3034347.1 divalent-cation tolerance protein CutA [Actinomycetota bacterium]
MSDDTHNNDASDETADDDLPDDVTDLLTAIADMAGIDTDDSAELSHVEVQITCGSDDEAHRIASTLVDERLAACVQCLPIHSVYNWDGEVQNEPEILLLAKTTSDRIGDLVDMVVDLHSYDVPAITAVPIVAGTTDYLDWVTDMTRPVIPDD